MKLADNWRTWHKRWSVRLNLLGSALISVLVASPDAAMAAWRMMPDELRIAIPSQYMPLLAVGLLVLSALSQLIRQERLHPPKADE